MPDDPFIVNMDPVQKIWMYENWLEDMSYNIDLIKNHAYLTASFSNPEGVRKAIDSDKNKIVSSDESFEKSLQMVRNFGKEKPQKRRRRIKDSK